MRKRPVGVILWSLFFILLGAYCLNSARYGYGVHRSLNTLSELRRYVCPCPSIKDGPFLNLYKAKLDEYNKLEARMISVLSKLFIVPILFVICGIFCVWSGVGVLLFRETARKLMIVCPLILITPLILLPNAALWQATLFHKMILLQSNLDDLCHLIPAKTYDPVQDPWKDIIQVDAIASAVCVALFLGVLFYFTRPRVKEHFKPQIQ